MDAIVLAKLRFDKVGVCETTETVWLSLKSLSLKLILPFTVTPT